MQEYARALRKRADNTVPGGYFVTSEEALVQEIQSLRDCLAMLANQAESMQALQPFATDLRAIDADLRTITGRSTLRF